VARKIGSFINGTEFCRRHVCQGIELQPTPVSFDYRKFGPFAAMEALTARSFPRRLDRAFRRSMSHHENAGRPHEAFRGQYARAMAPSCYPIYRGR
jgi:hypothetical protein